MLTKFFALLTALMLTVYAPSAAADDHEETGGDEAAEPAEPDPGNQVHVRLLTHFSKTMSDSGWGVGGWLIMPDIVKMGTTPLFLVGPRYKGDGYWVEIMAGGLVAPDPDPVNAGYTKTKTVQSTRFQLTPKLIGSPINVFGNLQFIDVGGEHLVTEQSTMTTYTFLMVDYVLPGKKALIGLETENYFGKLGSEMDGDEFETWDDIAIGPQVVLPFQNLNIIMSYQKHLDEDTNDQIWIRAMHNFGGPKKK
jgi:hypothetical protein